MNIIEFEIDGVAAPQLRPRATRTAKGIKLYDPPKSKVYKNTVKLISQSYMKRNHLQPLTGALEVNLEFYFKPPSSYTKKRLNAIHKGEELYIKKPDADNLAKAVTDAMNNIVYHDDAQITIMTISKDYAARNYAKVRVKSIE